MSVKKRLRLGGGELSDFERNLRAAARELRSDVPTKVTQDTALFAKREIELNLASIPNVDGNAIGTVEIVGMGPMTQVVNVGSQVGYLEFGTGAAGASKAHPRSAEAGYAYGGRTMWVYFNTLKQGFSTSHGLTPQAQVLRAAQRARGAAKMFARVEIRRLVASL